MTPVEKNTIKHNEQVEIRERGRGAEIRQTQEQCQAHSESIDASATHEH